MSQDTRGIPVTTKVPVGEELPVSWAILMAAVMISASILYGASMIASGSGEARAKTPLDNINPITKDDHILGDPDAPVIIVEYSDFECPFCKQFHETVGRLVEEYDGQVAWVYRHFPLEELHPVKARQEALASECVADIAGNDAFWLFADRFFQYSSSNNRDDLNILLPAILADIGVNVDAVVSCMEADTFAAAIDEDVANARATGGNGTPWGIMIGPEGEKYPIGGAIPYASLKEAVDLALAGR